MIVEILLVQPEHPFKKVQLKSSAIIGSSNSCEISLLGARISPVHAQILVNSQLIIKDLNSSSGTFVNGVLIESESLNINDVITIGNCQLKILAILDEISEPIFLVGRWREASFFQKLTLFSKQHPKGTVKLLIPELIIEWENLDKQIPAFALDLLDSLESNMSVSIGIARDLAFARRLSLMAGPQEILAPKALINELGDFFDTEPSYPSLADGLISLVRIISEKPGWSN